MSEAEPLPNQHKKNGKSFGPWKHRILCILIFTAILYSQNKIINLLSDLEIMNNSLRIIIQFVTIVILLSLGHQLLRYN